MKQLYIVTTDKALFDELSSYISSERSDCRAVRISSAEEASEAAKKDRKSVV